MEINNLEKRKEEMIDKNQFFQIKKGSDVMVVLFPEYRVEGEESYNLTSQENIMFHPTWLNGIHQCKKCECEDSYNFRHKNPTFQQIIVKESDVEVVRS